MKIAFPANGKVISSHFGHCIAFRIFELDASRFMIDQISIENSGEHKPGVLPQALHKYGVNVVIADGIGQNAIQLFNEMGIQVITGSSGLIEEALKRFLDGTLKDAGNICSH